MSHHIAKLFKAPLVLASAALVIHISTASAADSKEDIQQQVKEMLSGTPATHFVPQSGPHDAKVTTPAVDSQQFVKQLLLGTAAYSVGDRETSRHVEVSGASRKTEAQKRPVVSLDMQTVVRKMLLGQPYASDAS